jgi:hypothetical protein
MMIGGWSLTTIYSEIARFILYIHRTPTNVWSFFRLILTRYKRVVKPNTGIPHIGGILQKYETKVKQKI